MRPYIPSLPRLLSKAERVLFVLFWAIAERGVTLNDISTQFTIARANHNILTRESENIFLFERDARR